MYLVTAHYTFLGTDDNDNLIQVPNISDSNHILQFNCIGADIVHGGPLDGYKIIYTDDSLQFFKNFYLCAERDKIRIISNRAEAHAWENFYLIPQDTTERALLDKYPVNFSRYIWYGNILLNQGKVDDGEAIFKQCIERFSNQPFGYERYAHSAVRKGQYELALERYTLFQKKFPENVEAYLGQKTALIYLGRHTEAYIIDTQYKQKFPDHYLKNSDVGRHFAKTANTYSLKENDSDNTHFTCNLGLQLLEFHDVFCFYYSCPNRFVRVIDRHGDLLWMDSLRYNDSCTPTSDPITIKKGFLPVDRYTDGNMYHILYDHVRRAYEFTNLPMYDESINLCFLNTAWPYGKSIIGDFFTNYTYLVPKQCYHFETLYTWTGGDNLFIINQNDMSSFIAKLCKYRDQTCVRSPKYASTIYTNRLKANCRRLLHEKDFILKLKSSPLGSSFASPTCESSMPHSEQMNLFYNADTVISLHGANMVNLFACREGTKVIELIPPEKKDIKLYNLISNYFGLNYYSANIEANEPADSIFKKIEQFL